MPKQGRPQQGLSQQLWQAEIVFSDACLQSLQSACFSILEFDSALSCPGAGAWGGDRTDEQGVLEIIHHWGKSQQLLFQGPGFSHWISGDYGSTFEKVATPGDTLGFWNQIKTHPKQPDWLAAQVRRRDCLEAGARTNPWCAWDLFVSKVRLPLPSRCLLGSLASVMLESHVFDEHDNPVFALSAGTSAHWLS